MVPDKICAAPSCDQEVQLLFCPRHWALCPPAQQRAVITYYEGGKAAEVQFAAACAAAVRAVTVAENLQRPEARR